MIVGAAAKSFSESGYHAVRLEDIADTVGISTPALYRHFPNKYALFAETARHLADALAAAVEPIPVGGPDELRELLAALTVAAIENRRTGGIYRWESQFMQPDDAEYVRDIVVAQHRRIRTALTIRRPDLDRGTADVITAAMTSVVASPATHRASLSRKQIETTITDAALALESVDLPDDLADSATPRIGLPPAARREVLLGEAIRLFAASGFHDVTIDDIARAADLPASGVYRHFASKTDILEAAFWRASDRVTSAVSDALAASTTPREAIMALVAGYVELCHGNPELIAVYMAEIGNVGKRQRTALRNQQRLNVEEWSAWVARHRAEVSPVRARFLVHAALNVVGDLTRIDRRPNTETVAALGSRLLLVG
ncbi:putative TetR family transcriptional regulator [Gordonia soli NBRC 108243]|uniref:Putative TetR family transcriptional regulator n=2 Tax=Gordonia soli TaxID=320799 RepID=M0QLA8_9ACTN|nr:putative TetR family transcriptional regulator [Gordonia soli NBRC 108243]